MDEDKVAKKSTGRQSSNSETHTPVLRSRRGTTPTKAASVEKEIIKPASATNNPKAETDVTVEQEDDDTFETPRTTPDSIELPTSLDSTEDQRPKQLKVYSAKPPSPLSHVDPELFDEIIDEEDDPELVVIDNNINKSRAEKTSPTKTYSRRTRTTSSENATEGVLIYMILLQNFT